ncbi:high-potential iron-sulfur protein [Bradyrhizobium sp.]|uniref:high-potential iron-sulfur protein n=1 Tax=Bradyrhizobium sp. TaxID=376 RepID=UPI0025B82254|nr:high-potential iron-sulfur protein [Bradyrhizobium sp.]
MTESSRITRRQALTIAAGAAGASMTGATAVIGTTASAQAAKVAQKVVKYQDTPKGEQRCDNCDLFQAPSSCKNVDGTIAPQGWCIIYRKKAA